MHTIARNAFLATAAAAAALFLFPPDARAAESAVTLHTSTGDIFGTLSMPENPKGAIPVVLLISGSGPTDRDGNSPVFPGKINAQKQIADALAARGIASLRYDKRGIAASAKAMPAEKDIRFDAYVDDAAAWIALLHADPRFSKIVVAGHSEGALIGTIASERGNVAAFVSLDGAGRPAYTVLRGQLKPALPPALYAQADAALTQLQAGHEYTATIPAALQIYFRPSVQPYLISWFKYDPAVELGKLRIPVTIIQGTADVQVRLADAQALKAGDPSATLLVIDGMNHVLKHAPDISSSAAVIAGYTNPKLTVVPQVIDAIASAAHS